jgi:hypothetical protein
MVIPFLPSSPATAPLPSVAPHAALSAVAKPAVFVAPKAAATASPGHHPISHQTRAVPGEYLVKFRSPTGESYAPNVLREAAFYRKRLGE